ncbi:unnamed protein product [Rotaria magnacalcarata]|uniref:Uncharacterized protein n=1 Tax=Rotaria magnacalcarata TaxID=392030 RepID=A0A816QQ73_9BILA|nr:unnamed protein product [Rotaria magnacalcarata]CAF2063833.1 unnamed protein product [Rotaria magnacalcarata]CAF4234477.1 unnamed protein product [Rotaria magnacalcarata]CAF4414871.1 unnamed protein product [Rotaria magnacalcarata]
MHFREQSFQPAATNRTSEETETQNNQSNDKHLTQSRNTANPTHNQPITTKPTPNNAATNKYDSMSYKSTSDSQQIPESLKSNWSYYLRHEHSSLLKD